MEEVKKIKERFDKIKRPPMNAPHDQFLSDIRQSLEIDEDSIAGVLSFELSGQTSPFFKQIFDLSWVLKEKKSKLTIYKPQYQEDVKYVLNLIKFISDITLITDDLIVNLKQKYQL